VKWIELTIRRGRTTSISGRLDPSGYGDEFDIAWCDGGEDHGSYAWVVVTSRVLFGYYIALMGRKRRGILSGPNPGGNPKSFGMQLLSMRHEQARLENKIEIE
jgi:hypothetical protein